MGEEGVQQWKEILIPNQQFDSVVDLGCGVTVPYRQMLQKTGYKTLWCVDNRFSHDSQEFKEIGDHIYAINQDAFQFLEGFKDQSIDFLWASEFMEHIPPHKQQELFTLIVLKAKKYVLTFPTIKHHDFHKDWTHRPVMIPHISFLLYGDTAWEGMLTNIPEVTDIVMQRYNYKIVFRPRKMTSRARKEKLGEEADD